MNMMRIGALRLASARGRFAQVERNLAVRRFATSPANGNGAKPQQPVPKAALVNEGKELIKLMLKSLVLVSGLVASSGFVIETVKTLNPMPAPGRTVEIVDENGKPIKVHYQQRGDGDVTVILDGGVGETSFDWDKVTEEVGRFATVVAIDRPGLGFSSATQTPRTAMQISKEYKEILSKLNLPRDVVLVAHGAGGYNVRQLAADLEQEDALGFKCQGLVLVDALEENLRRDLENVSEPVQKALQAMDANGDTVLRLARFGIIRLITTVQRKRNEAKYSKEALPYFEFYFPTTAHRAAANAENAALPATELHFRESPPAKPFDFPCVVLSHGRADMFDSMKLQAGVDHTTIAMLEATWQNAQRSLAKSVSSTPATQLIVADAGHNIPHEKPEEITKVVQALVHEIHHKGDSQGLNSLKEGSCPI